MVEEIIYTSAEKGLKQGSRGFCTVVSTSGMALNIAERLESMIDPLQSVPSGVQFAQYDQQNLSMSQATRKPIRTASHFGIEPNAINLTSTDRSLSTTKTTAIQQIPPTDSANEPTFLSPVFLSLGFSQWVAGETCVG